MEIALFGTSADPPTYAHQQVIDWLGQRFAIVAVWAADNPDKIHAATLAQRTAMLEKLVAELPPSGVGIYPELSDRYTINSVAQARSIWPHGRLSLVIGGDLVEQIERWHRATELLAQVDLLVVPRPGWTVSPTTWQRLQSIDSAEPMLCKRQHKIITELATVDVSSSALRRHMLTHRLAPTIQTAAGQQGLTPAVREYIQAAGLYCVIS
jgi:nicotinate-nucleotide adenylyltransferase